MTPNRTGTARRWLPWVAGAALLVGAAVVTGPPRTPGVPFDPRSKGAAGLAGLVEVLEEIGHQIDIALEPSSDTSIVVLLDDRFDEERRATLRDWVADGGTLVLGDLLSPLAADVEIATGPIGAALAPVVVAPECDLLAGVPPAELSAATAIAPAPTATACFPVDGGSLLSVRPLGDGRLVVLADPGVFVNSRLGDAGNVVLAAALVSAMDGGAVLVADLPVPGAGERTLVELIPGRVRAAGWIAVVALVLFGLARGRRLGRPVTERMPLRIPGSQLVVGVGGLLHRAGQRAGAAERLRDDAAREVARRLGLPPGQPRRAVRDAALERGLDATRVATALGDDPVASDRDLVAVAAAAADIRSTTFAAPPGAGAAARDRGRR